MAVIKCKMCGGDLHVEEGNTVCECEYCGTRQTVPTADNEKKMTLFTRASRLLRNCEFDKASGVFETIVGEFPEEAEAYWGLVLCKYGIEYVDDPATGKKIPTCHRSSFESVLDDSNFEQACENTDAVARRVYRDEARQIEELRKNIIDVSGREEPYDIFISYKETDDNGERTLDSVIAQDIYNELTREDYRVFFSRISLESRLGTEYEPYIFAALNSAKVMLVVGTDYENFDSVWVKNEWSRFLKMIASGEKKTLIPVFKNMDAYDMPRDFSKLAAQDMGKVGAMQDLVRGVKKLIPLQKETTVVKETVIVGGGSNSAPLLKRAFMFLEDGDFRQADEYCERVLDQDPENALAYVGKLMAELKVRQQENLKDCKDPFDGSSNYAKAIRFGDEKLSSELKGYVSHIKERNENDRLTRIYDSAWTAMQRASNESAYKAAAASFRAIAGFKDADTRAEKCLELAEEYRKNEIYASARAKMSASTEFSYKAAAASFRTIAGFKDADTLVEKCMEQAEVCRKNEIYASAQAKMRATGDVIRNCEEAISQFKTLSGWKDADEQIYACQKIIEAVKAKEESERLERAREAERLARAREEERREHARKAEQERIAAEKAVKKRKKAAAIFVAVLVMSVAIALLTTKVFIPQIRYNQANALLNMGKYSEAIAAYEVLGSYKDSREKLIEAKAAKLELENAEAYENAENLLAEGDYNGAIAAFQKLGNYKDSGEKLEEARALYREFLLPNAQTGEYIIFGTYEQDNNTLNGKEDIEWLVLAKENKRVLVISRYALDCQPYNDFYAGVTWETCTLREWLNGSFLDGAFSADEQAMIPTVTVSADKNPSSKTNPGNTTLDKVFLLSIPEANKYFSTDEARKCVPTDYAKAKGLNTSDDFKVDGRETCWWWLRSPGVSIYSNTAASVLVTGSVYDTGYSVEADYDAVRPAMWINLES